MSKRKLRNSGVTTDVTLDASKTYKYSSAGALVELTASAGDNDIVFSGSKSSLKRISDLERNLSILAARTQTEDGSGSGDGAGVVEKANKLSTARTISLTGDVTGSVSFDGSSNASISATIAANSVALGTDTTGNYVASLVAGTGITLSNNSGEGATPTVAVDTSTIATKAYVDSSVQAKDNTDEITEGSTNLFFTNARARGAVSFTAGSGAYNSSTGVFTIPTNTNQLTNGASFITLSSLSAGTGVTYNSSTGVISIGQAVGTGDSVQFNAIGIGTAAGPTAGSIRATNEITAYYSDMRLKENIKPIENALAKTLALHGVTYNANDVAASFGYTNKETQVGLLAQDVKAVLPEVVVPAPFDLVVRDGKEVSKSGQDFMTVKYEKIVALLVEAIKELNDKVESLEAQLGGSKSL